ncbi:MAG: hypothetical protein EAZ66_05880 [Alphaproteobacteria bacterium]|nr:MAG: hypothetical protein EAZ66_05880 [Alphaproteobacteria bacterium]
MTTLTEEDRKKAHKATSVIRGELAYELKSLYDTHDVMDMSQPFNQHSSQAIIHAIINHLNRLNLISEIVSKNSKTPYDGRKLEELDKDFRLSTAELEQSTQEARDAEKSDANKWTSRVEDTTIMTTLTEEDRKKAHKATSVIRDDLADKLDFLYGTHDMVDMSQSFNQHSSQAIIHAIINHLNRLNLISEIVSKNSITPDDERKLEELDKDFRLCTAELAQSTQELEQTIQEARDADKSDAKKRTSRVEDATIMTTLTEEDRKKAHKATSVIRDDLAYELKLLYDTHDVMDMSQPCNQHSSQAIIHAIINHLNSLNLISEIVSKNSITPDDERKLEELDKDFRLCTAELAQSTQEARDADKSDANKWTSRVEDQKEKKSHMGVSFP